MHYDDWKLRWFDSTDVDGMARHGRARLGRARRGDLGPQLFMTTHKRLAARRGMARRGMARPGSARQGDLGLSILRRTAIALCHQGLVTKK